MDARRNGFQIDAVCLFIWQKVLLQFPLWISFFPSRTFFFDCVSFRVFLFFSPAFFFLSVCLDGLGSRASSGRTHFFRAREIPLSDRTDRLTLNSERKTDRPKSSHRTGRERESEPQRSARKKDRLQCTHRHSKLAQGRWSKRESTRLRSRSRSTLMLSRESLKQLCTNATCTKCRRKSWSAKVCSQLHPNKQKVKKIISSLLVFWDGNSAITGCGSCVVSRESG